MIRPAPAWPARASTIAIWTLGGLALVPILITLIGSFRTSLPGNPTTWGLAGWTNAYASPAIWHAIANTFVLVLIRVPLALAIGSVLTWLLVRTNVAARGTVEFLLWIAFFLPNLPMTMAWALLLDPHSGWVNRIIEHAFGVASGPFNIYSYSGIIWVHLCTTSIPSIVLLLGPAFRGMNPALEESAWMSGASVLTSFRRIVLPLLAPALAVATIVALIRGLEAFEVELFLGIPAGIRVFATEVQQLVTYEPPNYAQAMALATPIVFFLIGLALLYQRLLRGKSYATLTGKRSAAPRVDLGRWRLPASAAALLFVTVGVIVPAVALVAGSFMDVFGVASATTGSFNFTARHWIEVFHDSVFATSLFTTLALGVGTVVAAIVVYSIVAYVIVRSRMAGRDVLDVVIWLPWAIPGILLSLSLLWMMLGNPVLGVLYGTLLGLILAMLLKELPGGVQIMKIGMIQIGIELEEAASTSGARWWDIYRRVLLPLLAPTALTVAIFVFVGCVKDISTMILLTTPDTRPLSLLVLDYATGGSIEKASVVGVITTTLAVVVAAGGRIVGRAR